MPLTANELSRYKLVQFPTAVGGVVIVLNLPGIAAGQLVLDGAILARIYLGEIKWWDHPTIQAFNADLVLPRLPIVVVHRADSSGTPFLLGKYLAKVSPSWNGNVGVGRSIGWPIGVGVAGNEGVAMKVRATSGSIGYVEHAYVVRHKLLFVRMKNRDREIVSPNFQSFWKTVVVSDWSKADYSHVDLIDLPGSETWPIVGATFALMPQRAHNTVATDEAIKFFDWALSSSTAARVSEKLHYVPVPKTIVDSIRGMWAMDIRDSAGVAIYKIGK